jgi:hypothetical protein
MLCSLVGGFGHFVGTCCVHGVHVHGVACPYEMQVCIFDVTTQDAHSLNIDHHENLQAYKLLNDIPLLFVKYDISYPYETADMAV